MNVSSVHSSIVVRLKVSVLRIWAFIFCMFVGAVGGGQCFSQERTAQPVYTHPLSVSSSLRQIVEALGDRVYEKGKEQVSFSGTLESQGKQVQILVVKESPGYLRIELSGSPSKTIIHDLNQLTSSRGREEGDEELAELFTTDSAEGFLQGITQGGSLRKIGDCFVVEGVSGFGKKVDIYDLYAPAPVRQGKPYVARRYMFDSDTGLLSRVRYVIERFGEEVPVQVILSDYQLVSGYRLPGKVVRISEGKTTHTFTLQHGAIAPMGNSSLFEAVR